MSKEIHAVTSFLESEGMILILLRSERVSTYQGIWGGVSGAITVELGTEQETEEAVTEALSVLGRKGGFILSPVDNVREDTENAWRNAMTFIQTWKKFRGDYL